MISVQSSPGPKPCASRLVLTACRPVQSPSTSAPGSRSISIQVKPNSSVVTRTSGASLELRTSSRISFCVWSKATPLAAR